MRSERRVHERRIDRRARILRTLAIRLRRRSIHVSRLLRDRRRSDSRSGSTISFSSTRRRRSRILIRAVAGRITQFASDHQKSKGHKKAQKAQITYWWFVLFCGERDRR